MIFNDVLIVFLQLEAPLLEPDVLVCSVGTEILVKGVPDSEWEKYLDDGWDRDHVVTIVSRFPELVMQQASEQRPHKVSYKLYAADEAQAQGVVSNLRAQLTGAGISANVIFSGGEDLDVLPSRASKGKALSFLLKQLEESNGASPEMGVMVCGDSGNDVELFEVPDVYGCIVNNAHTELLQWYDNNQANKKMYHAGKAGPGGIRESLFHFGFAKSPVPSATISNKEMMIDLHSWFERYFNDGHLDPEYDDICDDNTKDVRYIADKLGEEFHLVDPTGRVRDASALLSWFRHQGRGSQVSAPSFTGHQADGAAGEQKSVFRIWLDGYEEKQIAQDVWLLRYYENQQRFPCNSEHNKGRSVRISSAIVRLDNGRHKIVSVHETWVDRIPSVEGVAGL